MLRGLSAVCKAVKACKDSFIDLMASITHCLKEFREVEATTSGGREFQSLIDLGKNEYVSDWILDCNCR